MASEQRQTLNFRTEGVIKCTVMAQPQPIIEWSFNGLRLSNNHGKYIYTVHITDGRVMVWIT